MNSLLAVMKVLWMKINRALQSGLFLLYAMVSGNQGNQTPNILAIILISMDFIT
jgi:hypothetical protein